MSVRLWSRLGYEMSLEEQRTAVMLAHGYSVNEIGRELGVSLNDAIFTVKVAQIKVAKSFGKRWIEILKRIPVASVMVLLLCVSVVMEDHAIVRSGARASRTTRRRDDSETGQVYQRASCVAAGLVIPKQINRWVF